MKEQELKDHLDKIIPSSMFVEQVGDEVKCHVSPDWSIEEDSNWWIRIAKTPKITKSSSPLKAKTIKRKEPWSEFIPKK